MNKKKKTVLRKHRRKLKKRKEKLRMIRSNAVQEQEPKKSEPE